MADVPEGGTARPRRSIGWKGLSRRNWREPLTITVQVLGRGAEGWVEIKTRGRSKRYAIDTCLLKVCTEINSRD